MAAYAIIIIIGVGETPGWFRPTINLCVLRCLALRKVAVTTSVWKTLRSMDPTQFQIKKKRRRRNKQNLFRSVPRSLTRTLVNTLSLFLYEFNDI